MTRVTRRTAAATASVLTIVDDRALGCTSTALSNAAMMILWLCLDSSGSLPTQCATSLQERQRDGRPQMRWMVAQTMRLKDEPRWWASAPADAGDDDDVELVQQFVEELMDV